jgi:hypothetical protein
MQFLSLAPTSGVEAKISQPAQTASVIETPAGQAIEIPVVEKTSRSDSSTTDESSIASPRGSVDNDAIAAEIKRQLQNQFLRLGN